jgi:hypothetical protein
MKFILTNELGRLTRWLRIMGFDTVYYKGNNMGTLIIEALRDDRFIVTRRQSKIDDLEKKTVVLTTDQLNEQIKEIIVKLNLKIVKNEMFTRCTLCNESLVEVTKEAVKERVPLHVYKIQHNFRQCVLCKHVYWRGSHWGNASAMVKEILGKPECR